MTMETGETAYLLTQLADECMEVAQRAHKSLQFGLAQVQPSQPLSNAERVTEELYDLVATIDMLTERGLLKKPDLDIAEGKYRAKKAKVLRYMAFGLGRAPHPEWTGKT